MQIVSLLIAEKGACWIERAFAWRSPANEVLALIQDCEESEHEFRNRVEQRLERLRSRSVWVEQILLLVAPRSRSRPDGGPMLQSIIGKLVAGPRPARVLLVPSVPDRVVALSRGSLSRMHAGQIQGTLCLDISPTQYTT